MKLIKSGAKVLSYKETKKKTRIYRNYDLSVSEEEEFNYEVTTKYAPSKAQYFELKVLRIANFKTGYRYVLKINMMEFLGLLIPSLVCHTLITENRGSKIKYCFENQNPCAFWGN